MLPHCSCSLSRLLDRATGTPRTGAASAGSAQALMQLALPARSRTGHSLLPKSEPDQSVITTHPAWTALSGARVPLGPPAGALDALENTDLAPMFFTTHLSGTVFPRDRAPRALPVEPRGG